MQMLIIKPVKTGAD